MFSSSTIIQTKKSHKSGVGLESKLISCFIGLAWFFLILFVGASLAEPEWLKKWTEHGKKAEASEVLGVANNYAKNKDYASAIKYYKKSLNMSPDLTEAVINLAATYANMGKFNLAEKALLKSLDGNPVEKYLVYQNLATLANKNQDFDQAEEYYLRAIEDDPYPKNSNLNFGNFYFQRQEYPKAIERLELSAKLRADFRENYIGRMRKEIYIFEKEKTHQNRLGDILKNETSFEDLKRFDKKIFLENLKNDAEYAKLLDQIGYAYMKTKNYEKAEEFFEKSLENWNSENNRAGKNLKTVQKLLGKKL